MHGREKLRMWIRMNELSYQAFGAQIGATGTSVYRWTSGLHTPRWAVMKRINVQTNGFVRPDDWLVEDKAEDRSAA